MKILVIALILTVTLASKYMNITCWDKCRGRCKARYGGLTDQCVHACNCPCDTNCESICEQYNLGNICKFKCGCFINFTFGYVGKRICFIGII